MLFGPHSDDSLSREFREIFERQVREGDVLITHEFQKPTKAQFEDPHSDRLIEYEYYGSYVKELMEREKNARAREKSLFQFDTMELVGGEPCITFHSVVGVDRLCDLNWERLRLVDYEEKMDPSCSIFFEVYVIAKSFDGLHHHWFEEARFRHKTSICFVFEEAFVKKEVEEERESVKRCEELQREDDERKAEKERRLKENQERFDKLMEGKFEREKRHRNEFFE